MTTTLYSSFTDISDAERATGALMDHGLKSENVSLIAHEMHAERHGLSTDVPRREVTYGPDGISRVTGSTEMPRQDAYGNAVVTTTPAVVPVPVHEDTHGTAGITTTTAGDAGVGAAKGAGIGLGVGVLAALAAVFLPGVGLVLGGGALALALGGAGGAVAAGAVAGGAFGYMKDQGVPDHAIAEYRENLDRGGALLAVTLDHNINRAEVEEILTKYHGTAINEYGARAVV